MTAPRDADVLVVGGGPGGSTTATFLAKGGLQVTLVERERFPRFKVGESLIPTCMSICERLGVLERVLAHGFQMKYGATFHDQEFGASSTFGFRPGRPWPSYTLDVHRAEFDQILLEHAAEQGVRVCQPATLEQAAFDADGVTAMIDHGAGPKPFRAGFMVDASGRDAFLAARQGRRIPRPNLGKVAVFAYFRVPRASPAARKATCGSTSSPRAGSGTSRSRTTRPAWDASSTSAWSRAARDRWRRSSRR